MDWYPTLLEICDIEKPDVRFDGHSIVPIFVSPDAESQHDVLHFQWQQRWSVRDDDWKLIQHNNKAGGKPRFELVNLADEKPEQHDYSKEKPAFSSGCESCTRNSQLMCSRIQSSRFPTGLRTSA